MQTVTTYTRICSVLSLMIGLTTFLTTQVLLDLSLLHSLIASISTLFGVFVLILVDRKFQFSGRVHSLVSHLRKESPKNSDDAGIVITKWRTDIDINRRRNAILTYIIAGRGYNGINKWYDVSIKTDNEQPSKDDGFYVKITDLLNGEDVEPEFLIDEPKFKRVRINFSEPLTEGRKFRYRMKVKVFRTFSLSGLDFWYHKVLSNQKKVELLISFPSGYFVRSVFGEAHTQHGRSVPISQVPKKFGPRQIRWVIRNPMKGRSYKIQWHLGRNKQPRKS